MMIIDAIKLILKSGYEYISNHPYTERLYAFYQALFQGSATQTNTATTTALGSETESASNPGERAVVSSAVLSISDLATVDHPKLTFVEQLRIAKNNLTPAPQATAAEQQARQTEYRKNRMCIQAARYNSSWY